MPARRFFVRDRQDVGKTIGIEGGDAHKIVRVLRLRSGDRIQAVDSAGQVFDAQLEVEGMRVSAHLESLLPAASGRAWTIDVAQGVPKGSKMDYVVEKLSEVGVRSVIPLLSERTVSSDVGSAKLERWRRLARAAGAQSGRTDVLRVEEPAGFDALCSRMSAYDAVLLAWEAAEPEPLSDRLPRLVRGAARVLVAVGPEGGFSHAEAERAREHGAALLWLGPTILRTETAALVTVAILTYELA